MEKYSDHPKVLTQDAVIPVFSNQRTNSYLKEIAELAKIQKHLTSHCARHSFAVNVLTKGANIKTVSSLLGHTSIKMTERYLHVVDSLKQDAIDSLGEINFTPAT